jgi:hypothetical protein
VSICVHPLEVETEHLQWPERSQRLRRWFKAQEAARAVESPELRTLLLSFARTRVGHAIGR